MIQQYPQQMLLLLKRMILVFVLYTFCRLVFYFCNQSFFVSAENVLLRDLWHGLRFDSFSIIISNSLFILLSILPVGSFYRLWYQRLLKILFIISNSLFLSVNFVDAGYFSFTRKRSTADLLQQVSGQSDLAALIPAIVSDYWWLLVLFVLCLFVMIRIYPALKIKEALHSSTTLVFGRFITLLILIIFLCVLGLRGGLQPAPIDIVDAGAATSPGREAIVLNTPFTIIKSLDKKPLTLYEFYEDSELSRLYPTLHHEPGLTFTKKNLVVIVLESFSKGYTGLGGGRSFTPFLDSLMQHSTVFTNAYSNSSKSIEGLPAILSSLPSYMDNPFINSRYANNRQTSFASLLSGEGYSTAFFHGGKNGTMNFTEWSRLAGYQKYYGMDEYDNENDYDSYWGVYDEPFLQYSAEQIAKMPVPFHAALFTLSSHHPYLIPDRYRKTFAHAGSEVGAALLYADHALKQFFEKASRMKWYRNTLFVLVADHATISKELFIPDPLGNLRIPIVIFDPSDSRHEKYPFVFGQADILPEVMHQLGYNKPFFSFGKQARKREDHFVCYYGDGRHHIITDSLYYLYSGPELHSVHHYIKDSTLSGENIHRKYPALDKMITARYHAMLQVYGEVMVDDNGVLK